MRGRQYWAELGSLGWIRRDRLRSALAAGSCARGMYYSARMQAYLYVRNHYCPDNTPAPPAEVLNKQETGDKIGQDRHTRRSSH